MSGYVCAILAVRQYPTVLYCQMFMEFSPLHFLILFSLLNSKTSVSCDGMMMVMVVCVNGAKE